VPPRSERQIHAEVAGLQVEVHDLRQALDKNTESLSEVREGFQRLRGELNGVLPRLEEKVERVIDHLNGREETEREYFEKVRVHETEIGNLAEQVRKKADAEANREEHSRLWLALRLFFYGTLVALLGLLVERVLAR
jgi:chromosome segregation ATPase